MAHRSIIFVSLFVIASSANAMGKQWVDDWWDNVYEQRVEKEQYEELKEQMDNECSTKIEWYERKVEEKPSSEYYQYKLDSWKERCE